MNAVTRDYVHIRAKSIGKPLMETRKIEQIELRLWVVIYEHIHIAARSSLASRDRTKYVERRHAVCVQHISLGFKAAAQFIDSHAANIRPLRPPGDREGLQRGERGISASGEILTSDRQAAYPASAFGVP